jgi:hypothetical protein
VDHPVHTPQEHTVNIDFLNPERGPSARVAVELTEEAALALADAIHRALATAPPGLAAAVPPGDRTVRAISFGVPGRTDGRPLA